MDERTPSGRLGRCGRQVFAGYLAAFASTFWSALATAQAEPGVASSETTSAPSSAPASEAVAAPTPATTPAQYLLENGQVLVVAEGTRTRLPIPGPVIGLYRSGGLLYVARGPRGAAVYDLGQPTSPVLQREVSFPHGNVTGFSGIEGQVWAVVTSRTAVPMEELATLPPRAEGGAGSPPVGTDPAREDTIGLAKELDQPVEPSPRVGLRPVSPGTVELDVGAAAGVRVGDSYLILRSTSLGEGVDGDFVGEERVAVAEVVAVSASSALAQVGRSARVASSDFARRATPAELKRHKLPPLVPRIGEVSLVLRPLVKVGTPLGGGLLADLEATYWGRRYFAGLRVEPLGLGFTRDGNVVSSAALFEGGYEASSFAVGLGIGAGWVNGDLDYMLESFEGSADSEDAAGDDTRTITERQETHGAFALSQVARLGSRDGLHFSLRNLLILHEPSDGGDAGFIYGGTTGKLVIPVARRTDFIIEGGGGVMGYWFFGLGTGTFLVGNGSPGSWYLSTSAGAAGIYGSREVTTSGTDWNGEPYSYTNEETVSVVGPMVSVGLARRFGL